MTSDSIYQDCEETEELTLALQCKSFFQVIPPPAAPSSFQFQEFLSSRSLSLPLQMQISDLFMANMEEKYREAGWKCDLIEKQKELFHPASRFLLLTQKKGDEEREEEGGGKRREQVLVGYLIFRFTWDDEDEPEYPVLYVYELQVDSRFRRKGVGAYLVNYAVQLAEHFNMRKVMLTCLKNNPEAMSFYRKIGFGIDVNSPSRAGFMKEVYEILSNHPDTF